MLRAVYITVGTVVFSAAHALSALSYRTLPVMANLDGVIWRHKSKLRQLLYRAIHNSHSTLGYILHENRLYVYTDMDIVNEKLLYIYTDMDIVNEKLLAKIIL